MTFRLTKTQKTKLIAAWGRVEAARASGATCDPLPVVKLFTPDAGATWLLVAMSPDESVAWAWRTSGSASSKSARWISTSCGGFADGSACRPRSIGGSGPTDHWRPTSGRGRPPAV